MKILIVEDEELYADKLEMLVEKLEYELVGIVDNSADALAKIRQNPPDLILMDVHIQGQHDGIELADLINREFNIPVIFITSLLDDLTFNRAARAKPIYFLNKPFSDIQLQRSIELTVRQLGTQANDTPEWEQDVFSKEHLFIKVRQKLEKVAIKDIVYLEADGRYCQIFTERKKYLVRLSLQECMALLPATDFLQTHRSYLINTEKIQTIDLQDNFIQFDKFQVPLSKRHREVLLKKLNWL
jgi:DNA-binding LytR/AlgR family response regulator